MVNYRVFAVEFPSPGQIIYIYPKSGDLKNTKKCSHCHGTLYRVEMDFSFTCVRCKDEYKINPDKHDQMSWSYVYPQKVPANLKPKAAKAPAAS